MGKKAARRELFPAGLRSPHISRTKNGCAKANQLMLRETKEKHIAHHNNGLVRFSGLSASFSSLGHALGTVSHRCC